MTCPMTCPMRRRPPCGVLRAFVRAGVRGFLLEQVVGHVVPSRLGKRVVVARLKVLGELVVGDRSDRVVLATSGPGSRAVLAHGQGCTPRARARRHTRKGVNRVAAQTSGRPLAAGGGARSRVRTAWASPSRGKGQSPSAERPVDRHARGGQVADGLGDDPDRVALLLDEVAVDERRRARARPRCRCVRLSTTSRRARPLQGVAVVAERPVARSPRPGRRRAARRRRATRTTRSPEVWPRPGWTSSTSRSPRSSATAEEKVWSAGTISVSAAPRDAGRRARRRTACLTRSPAARVRSAALSWAWIGTGAVRLAERAVAEGVVEVLVGVDDRGHRADARARGRRRRWPGPLGRTPGCRRPAGRRRLATRQTLTSNHS